jgi:hypothetical protein
LLRNGSLIENYLATCFGNYLGLTLLVSVRIPSNQANSLYPFVELQAFVAYIPLWSLLQAILASYTVVL